MIASDTQQVNLRLPAGMVKEIDRSVRKGLFRSRQEFIMAAIREELGKNGTHLSSLFKMQSMRKLKNGKKSMKADSQSVH